MKLVEPLAIKDKTSSKCAQVFVMVVKREQKRSSNNALLSVGNLLAELKPRPKPRLAKLNPHLKNQLLLTMNPMKKKAVKRK
jgi:hypothetical protein